MKNSLAGFGFVFLSLASLLNSCGGGSGGSAVPLITGLGVSSFSPPNGEVGSLVTILGKGFGSDPFAITARFGGPQGVPGPVQLATDTQIIVAVPPGAISGAIIIQAPQGLFSSVDSFRVLPTLVLLTPPGNEGAAVGDQVEILGYGFDGQTPENNDVSFSGIPASIDEATSTRLIATVPPGSRTGEIRIATADGVLVQPYKVKPSISGYSPFYGNEGDVVSVVGANFQDTPSANQVSFDGVPASVISSNYSTMLVEVPVGFDTGPVTITTIDGSGVGPLFFKPATPLITGLDPISGLVGTPVRIQGTGFLPGVSVVKFNGIVANISNATTTQLDVRVPLGASTGLVEVSQAEFGSDLSPIPFTVLLAPAVTSLYPGIGAWGSPITITGTNLDPDPAGNLVKFNGVVAPVISASPTEVVASVPANAFSGTVTLETDAGLATAPSPFQVVFSRYAVVANETENTISSYEMDGALGQLRFQSFSPALSGAAPSSVAVNVAGTMAYVANASLDSLSRYEIGLDGRLTWRQTIPTGDNPAFVALHPSNNFVYVANKGTTCTAGTISAYAVGAGGELTAVNTGSLGAEPSAIAFHPNGQFLYATASQSLATACPPPPNLGNSVRTFNINPATGAITGSFRTGVSDGPVALYIHPAGNWLYIACYENDTVHVYETLSDGKLALRQSVLVGDYPVALAADPIARYLYVVNRDSNDISGFTIQSDGSLASLGGNVPAGTAPSAIMLDYAGKAYVTNRGSGTISIFSVGASGSLSWIRSLQAHRGPTAIARVDGSGPVLATPQFAYAAVGSIAPANDGVANSIVPLFVNAPGGGLVPNGSPVVSGANPVSIVADPTGQFLYSANSLASGAGAAVLSMYSIENNGTLTENGSIDVGAPGGASQPTWVGVEPSGNFLLTKTSGNPGAISAFRIDRDTSSANFGKLTAVPGSPFTITDSLDSTASNQLGAALHPSGRFLYVEASSFDDEPFIVSCSVNLATGEVAPLGTIPTATYSTERMVIHPSGIGFYSALPFVPSTDPQPGNKVAFYRIGDGGVALPSTHSQETGNDPHGIAISPDGRFLFTANLLGDSVSVLPVNPDGTLLPRLDANPASPATIEDFDAGDAAFAVSVDRSGRFLYVTNAIPTSGNTGLTRVFSIASDGRLTPVGTNVTVGEKPQALTTVSTYQ